MLKNENKALISALLHLTESVELLTSRLDKLESSTKERFKSIQNSLDLLYADREILEKVSGKVTALDEQWSEHRTHIDNMGKDLKNDVNEVRGKVEDKVGEIKDAINDNMEAVVDSIDSKKTVFYVKEGFFTTLKRLFKKQVRQIKEEVSN